MNDDEAEDENDDLPGPEGKIGETTEQTNITTMTEFKMVNTESSVEIATKVEDANMTESAN